MEARTYREDLELFKELGLTPFEFNDQEKHFLGEYELPYYEFAKIKISVVCMPAQFWFFEITTEDNDKYEMQTGSGCLSTYWTAAVNVAKNMIEIKKVV